jgi:hypothetical protein
MAKIKKSEEDIVMQRENRLDNLLFECMEIMRSPEKWAVDGQGNIINVYPHPIVEREAREIKEIVYKPHKSYYLPDVLLERAIYWEGILEQAKKKAHRTTAKGTKVIGRPKKYSEAQAIEWAELREQGLTLAEIAKQSGAKPSTVSYYVNKLKVKLQEVN